MNLKNLTTTIDWPLPEKEHIAEQINKMLDTASKRDDVSGKFKTNYSDEEKKKL